MDDWVWCLHCERCYPSDQAREGKLKMGAGYSTFTLCHYPDCDGQFFGDGWDWEAIRKANPEYPEVPEMGKVYPHFGK